MAFLVEAIPGTAKKGKRMGKLKIAALAVLFGALFPLAALMMPKPFIALTPLMQRGEVPMLALSACQWICIAAAALIFAAVVSLAFKRERWVPAVLAVGAVVSIVIVAFDRYGELYIGLSAIRVLLVVYLVSLAIWLVRRKKEAEKRSRD